MDVFYFWEGDGRLPGCIELCLATWRHLPRATIHKVDYTNVVDMTGGLIAPRRIARYPLAVQSDLIAAAVLAHRGGLFLDADTIILEGFDPARYSPSICTLYGPPEKKGASLAFVMAPRGNAFVSEWTRRGLRALNEPGLAQRAYWDIRKRLTGKPAKVGWDWLGPAIVDNLLSDPSFAGSFELRDHVRSGMYPYPALVSGAYGPETYRQILFSPDDRAGEILDLCRDGVLALQNSWHPRDFQSLSAAEVLAGRSTLSRLLARTLKG